jgi:hypothetical protein
MCLMSDLKRDDGGGSHTDSSNSTQSDNESQHDDDSDDVKEAALPSVRQRSAEVTGETGESEDQKSGSLQHKWDEMFNRLVEYREKHGDCLVPNRYPEDPQLGSWGTFKSASLSSYKLHFVFSFSGCLFCISLNTTSAVQNTDIRKQRVNTYDG